MKTITTISILKWKGIPCWQRIILALGIWKNSEQLFKWTARIFNCGCFILASIFLILLSIVGQLLNNTQRQGFSCGWTVPVIQYVQTILSRAFFNAFSTAQQCSKEVYSFWMDYSGEHCLDIVKHCWTTQIVKKQTKHICSYAWTNFKGSIFCVDGLFWHPLTTFEATSKPVQECSLHMGCFFLTTKFPSFLLKLYPTKSQ